MTGALGNTLKELLSSTTGKTGVAFFVTMVGISIFALTTNPLDFGTRFWNNPSAWADNPKNVPPGWLGGGVKHTVFEATEPTEVRQTSRGVESLYVFDLDYGYDDAPTFTSFSLEGVTYESRPTTITVSVQRPDGRTVSLYRHVVPAQRPGESSPVVRYRRRPSGCS